MESGGVQDDRDVTPAENLGGIDRRFVIALKGREYALYGGVLDAATRAGIKSLTTTVLQLPTAENGNLAIVSARLETEDGRVFEDLGDCCPASTTPQLAAASLRVASTRAKGRVLRDSINCSATLAEELGGEEAPQGRAPAAARQERRPVSRPQPAPATGSEGAFCSSPECGQAISKNEQTRSQHHYQVDLCKVCFPKWDPKQQTASA
jgi:hypothetical protein